MVDFPLKTRISEAPPVPSNPFGAEIPKIVIQNMTYPCSHSGRF